MKQDKESRLHQNNAILDYGKQKKSCFRGQCRTIISDTSIKKKKNKQTNFYEVMEEHYLTPVIRSVFISESVK